MAEALANTLIENRYLLKDLIGQGSFGCIYLAEDKQKKETVAIKIELRSCKFPQLHYEYKLYQLLSDGAGIPRALWFGTFSNDYNALVLEFLGPNLEELFHYCNRRFTLKTVLMLIDQMLSRIQYLHSKQFIHRDIKPDNFVVGRDQLKHVIYLIDFGLAKRYIDPITMKHIPYSEDKKITGTIRYVSRHTHLGVEQSRRDDLESLGYVWLYFLKGKLPWQGLRTTDQQKQEKKTRDQLIMSKKMDITLEELCSDVPIEFQHYFRYCRRLSFVDNPDYQYIRKLFSDLFFSLNYKLDYQFDWLCPPTTTTTALK